MQEFRSPQMVDADHRLPRLFLGGSIENGKASDWQSHLSKFIDVVWDGDDIVVLNPRRLNWDPTLEMSMANETFRVQVVWELGEIEDADVVLMNLEPGTLSPISLMELGFLGGMNHAGLLNKCIVCCPEGFWRKGNVDVFCDRYHISVVDTTTELLQDGLSLLVRNHARRMTSLPQD
jgi:hypothetical protein